MKENNVSQADESRIGEIVDEFLSHIERGKQPDVEKFVQKHPEVADILRHALPALMTVAESIGDGDRSVIAGHNAIDPDEPLGDFRIIREIGRGGMGVVYEARQVSLCRKVAIKVLPFVGMVRENALQRFHNEVRAAAALDHPNIVSVYSVGEERGVHYYAMQLVRGKTLADLIKHLLLNETIPFSAATPSRDKSNSNSMLDKQVQTRESSPPDNDQRSTWVDAQANIETRASNDTDRHFYSSLAKFGIQAANALQHAHENGVIHRDIKPSNLMIDADSNLYVTDFGLARIETDAAMTMTGDLIGTLRYMSPEQASGQQAIDYRTDIYGLGVTLYELLTKRQAFPQSDRKDLLRNVMSEEPRAPRQINRTIPRDLETIVLKAIAKEPNERYGSAVEMADDLNRYLKSEPITACPPTLGQRAMKYTRRHPSFVMSVAVMLVLALLGTTVSSVLLSRAYAEVEQQRQVADENFQLARSTVDDLLESISENEVLDTPALQPLRRQLLSNVLTYYTAFVAKQPKDDDLQVELANAYWRVGEISVQLGDRSKSREAHEQALRIRKQLVSKSPENDEHQYHLAESYTRLARYAWAGTEKKKLAQAEKLAQQAQQLASRLYARESSEKYAQLLSECLLNLGNAQGNRGDFVNAERQLTKAVDIRENVTKNGKSKPEHLWELAESYRFLGQFYNISGDKVQRSKASKVLEKGLEVYRKVKVEAIGQIRFDRGHARCNTELGRALQAQNQLDDAIKQLQIGIEIASISKKANPALVWPRYLIGSASQAVASIYRKSERLDDAVAALNNAIREYEELGELGDTFRGRRRSLARCHHSLAEVHRDAGKLKDAVEAYRKSEEQWKVQVQEHPNDWEYVDQRTQNLRRWSDLHRELGEIDDEVRLKWECIRNLEQLASEFSDVPAYPWRIRLVYEQLLEASKNDPLVANRLAWFLATTAKEQVRDSEEAIKLASGATAARKENAFFWYTLGVALYRAHRFDEAADAFSKARKNRNENSRAFAGFFFAMNAWQLNRQKDARRLFHEAVFWMEEQNCEDRDFIRFRREAAELLKIKS